MKYLVALLFLFFVGCSPSQDHSYRSWYEQNGKIKVLSTTGMIDALVGEIGGERVDHIPLIRGDIDPHSYELVKGDDEKILFADLVVCNGLNLEHGASICYHIKKHPHSLYLGDEVQKQVPHRILSIDGEIDPHIWMDISLWAEGIDPIVSALIQKDPEYAGLYKKNGDRLRQQMLHAHRTLQKQMREVPEDKRYIVTSHDAFHYFTAAYLCPDRFIRERCVAPEGLAPEGQLSAADIQRVIDHLCAYKVEVVFPESNVNRDALKKIVASCKSKGHEVRICQATLFGDSMGENSYLEMIQHNADVLKREWMP